MEKEKSNSDSWVCPNCETPNSNLCEVCDFSRPIPIIKTVVTKKEKPFKVAFILTLFTSIGLGFFLSHLDSEREYWENNYYDKEMDYDEFKFKVSNLNNVLKKHLFSSGVPYNARNDKQGYYGDNTGKIFFTVHSDIIFKSVAVDAKGSGYLKGYIYTIDGDYICMASNSEITNYLEVLEFDCYLKKGDYYITHRGNVELLYNSGFSDYPIGSNDFLTITRNSYGSNYYMNFYDWKYTVVTDYD